MPSNLLRGRSSGAAGGGAGFTLGSETNEFGITTTADKAAAEVLRDAYATANTDWLAEYNDNTDFLIELNWTGGGVAYQRRNAAGDGWEDVSGLIRGARGPTGTVPAGSTGPLTLTALAGKSFTAQGAPGSSQLRELFASDITLPADAADDEVFMLDIQYDGGSNSIPITKAYMAALLAVGPVTWASSSTVGITAVFTPGATRNSYYFPFGQNRGFCLGFSTDAIPVLLWGISNTSVQPTLQLYSISATGGRGPAGPAGADLTEATEAERTAGTEAAIRSFSPSGVAEMVREHRVHELDANEPLPTPTATSAKFVYRPGTPAQFWIKEFERHSLVTGSAGQTHILPGSSGYPDFEGVLSGAPPVASASVGDYYFDYYYSRRHFYEFVFVGPALTGANRWAGVEIGSIHGDPLGPDAVFVGEATGAHAAILMIDPDEYDATHKYYYVHVAQRRLYLLSNIVLPTNPFTSYAYRALQTTPSLSNPTGIWYIHGQTERWPSSYAYTIQPASSRLRLRWSGDAPNEALYGWPAIGDIWPAAISGNIDGSANPANTTANVVFGPAAGRYDIHATIGIDQEDLNSIEFGIFLYKIQAGDDLIMAATSGRTSDLPANFGGTGGTVLRMDAPDIEVSSGDQFYVMIFYAGTESPEWRGFLKLVRKG